MLLGALILTLFSLQQLLITECFNQNWITGNGFLHVTKRTKLFDASATSATLTSNSEKKVWKAPSNTEMILDNIT